MSKKPWMAFFPSDYFADTFDLTLEQHGAYLVTLMTMWGTSDCSLPASRTMLIRLLQSRAGDCHHKKAHAILDVILPRFFTPLEGDKLTNVRLRKEWDKASIKAGKASDSASIRWAKPLKNNDRPDAEAMLPDTDSQTMSKDIAEPAARRPLVAGGSTVEIEPAIVVENALVENPKAKLFSPAVIEFLSAGGKRSPPSVRSLIGQMLKLAGGDGHANAVLGIVRDAYCDPNGKADPGPWCLGVIKKQREAVLNSNGAGVRPAPGEKRIPSSEFGGLLSKAAAK